VLSQFEGKLVARFKAAVPPLYYEQRDQFARSLPLLALLSVVLAVALGGWIGAALSLVRMVGVAPGLAASLLVTPFFWVQLIPPILWAVAYVPLSNRRLLGWRLFVLGTLLALIGSLLRFSLISLLFSGAILYFTLQCYDEFSRR
jgi:hypothetical protein